MQSRYVVYGTAKPSDDIAGWAYVQYMRPDNLGGMFPPNTYMINQVYTVPAHRGKGYGARIMNQIIDDADLEGATLILDVDPGVDNYAPTEQDHERLVNFYRGFGFIWNDELGGMIRTPQERHLDVQP